MDTTKTVQHGLVYGSGLNVYVVIVISVVVAVVCPMLIGARLCAVVGVVVVTVLMNKVACVAVVVVVRVMHVVTKVVVK